MKPEDAYPLCWPPGRKRRVTPKRSQFGDASFARARDSLIHQVKLLGGSQPILSTNVPLKSDGLPYANRNQPQDKGVAVYFVFKKRPMVFACDEWDKIEHNVWAIAKTIEALRGIERWGSGDMLERAFTGFAALPSPESKKHWREILGFMGYGTVGINVLEVRHKELAKLNHPDVGGDSDAMAEINSAFEEAKKEVLR